MFIFRSSCFPSVLWWGKSSLSNFNLKEFLCVLASLICLFINECVSVGCLCKVTHASVKTSQNSRPWHENNLKWNGTLGLDWKHGLLQNTFFKINYFSNIRQTHLERGLSHLGSSSLSGWFSASFRQGVSLLRGSVSLHPELQKCYDGAEVELPHPPKLLKLPYCMQQRSKGNQQRKHI